MKINELKNIIPMKYNSFYSVHGRKTPSKITLRNLPMIKTFSRNINKELNNILLTMSKENKQNNNLTNLTYKSINNTGKIAKNNFSSWTNYIRNKFAKKMTKIKNKSSTPNKVKEIKLNVNQTEYNNFNKKYYLVDKIYLQKPNTQIKLLKNKNKLLTVEEIYNRQKEEYKNIINTEEKRNKFLKNYSSFIYYQIFAKRMRNEYSNNNRNIPNFFNFYLIKNLKKSYNIFTKNNQNDLIKTNYFFDYVIENVAHKVEYQNQKNERITIELVKNLLDEELNIVSNKLNSKNDQNISNIDKANKMNKSTSTNDFNDLKFLNKTYDKISYTTSNSENDFEEKIKKKIENKLFELNKKYGFMNKSDNIFLNDKAQMNESHNVDNFYMNETERDMKIKSKENLESDEDNYIGDYIWAIADDINNIDEFRKRTNEKDNIFENTKIKNIFTKHSFNKNKNEKVRDFGNMQISVKKNIDFKAFENDIKELYSLYKLKKELEMKKKSSGNKSIQNSPNGKNENNIDNINKNSNNLNKGNENKSQIKFKISSNLNLQNILSLMNDEQKFEQIINGFGGYYTDNNDKKIFKQIKESNPNKKNIFTMYNEIRTNIEKEKQKKTKNLKRNFYGTENKSILYKAYKTNYDDNKKKNSILLKEEINNNTNIENNTLINFINNEENNSIEKDNKNQKKKIKQKNIKKKKVKNISDVKDKNIEKNENNKNIDNNSIDNIKENSYENEGYNKFEDELTQQEKEDILNNKTTYEKNKKVKFKNFKTAISNNTNIDSDKIKINIQNIKENKNLDDIEKDFLVKINTLTDLDEKDKKQIMKYLEELEKVSDNDSSNLNNKIKINNIHQLLKNYIKEYYNKDNKNEKSFRKDFKRKKTDYFINIKNRLFLEKQKKIIEKKNEHFGLEEDEEKVEQNITPKKKRRKKTKIFDFDDDSNLTTEKGIKRSRSFRVKKKKKLTRIDNDFLAKLMGRSSIIRSNSAKKEIIEDDWRKYLSKTTIHRRNKQNEKKKTKSTKRKKKTRIIKNAFFVDEYNNIKNELDEQDDEIERIKKEIIRKKKKKELVEKQLYEFFNRIQALKKSSSNNTQKEIEILIDEQLEKMEYTKAKENESRVNNFIQDFDLNRTKNIFSKKFHSRKMHYLSPINFFTKQNEEKNSL